MTKPCYHLLLVEEEAVLAEVTAFRLELLGYEVHVAPSAEAALEYLRGHRADLAIIDRTLPGLSGLALVEQLSSDPSTSALPIMMLSFDSEHDQVQQAFQVGASDFLVAPYDPRVLEEKVAALLARVPATAAATTSDSAR